ncbi:hypothetical protein J6590_021729 [Homalodisca vitripennis]|nr:hypothetical protein J6590_021729 [Homalodisca vitripennis]
MIDYNEINYDLDDHEYQCYTCCAAPHLTEWCGACPYYGISRPAVTCIIEDAGSGAAYRRYRCRFQCGSRQTDETNKYRSSTPYFIAAPRGARPFVQVEMAVIGLK